MVAFQAILVILKTIKRITKNGNVYKVYLPTIKHSFKVLLGTGGKLKVFKYNWRNIILLKLIYFFALELLCGLPSLMYWIYQNSGTLVKKNYKIIKLSFNKILKVLIKY